LGQKKAMAMTERKPETARTPEGSSERHAAVSMCRKASEREKERAAEIAERFGQIEIGKLVPPTESFTIRRRYLTEREVERLIEAAKRNRHGQRDSTMILVAYRHGLPASEVCGLAWQQIQLDAGRLHVRRAQRGTPSVHPIRGHEIRALRKLRRENPMQAYVFVSERGGL
jgi:integrase